MPATGGVSWIVDAEIEVPSTDSENVARTRALTGTFVAPSTGVIETTLGATVSAAKAVRKYVTPRRRFAARSSNDVR